MRKLIFALLLFVFTVSHSCAQQTIYGWLAYSHSYTNIAEQPIDTTDLVFYVYYSDDPLLTYSQYIVTPDTTVYLLATDTLYQDKDWWFFVKAYQLSNTSFSEPSDTVSEYFPKLIPGKSYNLKFFETGWK